MRVVAIEGESVEMPPTVSHQMNVGAITAAVRVGSRDQITTAEVWFSDHDQEVFMNGAAIRRSLPDSFYDFREAVLSRHDIYG